MDTVTLYPKAERSDALSVVASHLDYLDGLRALAALYVVIHHAVLQVAISSSESALVKVIALLFAHGRYAVDLFIVISGFCLMLPVVNNNGVLRGGTSSFIKRRIKRILPTYYVAMAISLLLIYTIIGAKTGTNWDGSVPVTNKDIITHLLLIQDVFYSTIYKINHVFWSISVEFHIYFLFPVLVLSWKRMGAVTTTLAAIAFSLVLWYILARTGLNVYGMSPHYLALFSFGMLAAQLAFSNLKVWQVLPVGAFILFAIIAHPIVTADFLVGAGSACLLVVAASGKPGILRSLLSWQPLVFVGTFAYSIYLIHAPLLQVFSQYVIAPLGFSPLLAIIFFLLIGIPLILGGSYLFFLIAERPFMRK